MQFVNDFQALELVIRFGIPLLIFGGLVLSYIRIPTRKFLISCKLDIRVIALLTIGAITSSFINIPIFFGENILYAINLGGVIIPLALSGVFIYELRVNPTITIISVLVVSFFSYQLSYIDPNSGFFINFPWFIIPIFISVLLSFVIFFHNPRMAIPYAYSISTLGMLIGVDIIHFSSYFENDLSIGYFGGHGIFDLIFISGLLAIAISLPLTYSRLSRDKIYLNYNPIRIGNEILVAPLKKRMGAFIIDITIQILVFCFIGIVLLLFYLDLNLNDLFTGILGYSIFWWAVFFHLLYFIIFESISGQSIGKWLMRIQVIRLNNLKFRTDHQTQPLGFLGSFTRNILRIMDLILLIINIFYFISTPKKQRMGDILAESLVINIE